ncbi:MAG: hypothetical protein HY332_00035 [Chloroflexi bacterium]|nr:hypothetical protein [Chloroflexota bacterium]
MNGGNGVNDSGGAVALDGLGHLGAVAHELRGPVHALALSAELLLDQIDGLPPHDVRSHLAGIHRRALWLEGLMENLLCATLLQQGRLRLQRRPAQLLDLVDECWAIVAPLLAEKQQRLEVVVEPERDVPVDVPADQWIPEVMADSRRLGQVLINLLLNAHKYSPPGTTVTVSVARLAHHSSRVPAVRVCVEDRGPGIPVDNAEDAARLFAPFYRTPQAIEASTPGVGLGLAIVKAVVDAHGGRVGAYNRAGGGACFWFDLPTTSVPVVDAFDAFGAAGPFRPAEAA